MKKLRDIAKIAGVSLSTASRVINNDSSVNYMTRQKVLDVIKKEKYVPNCIARSLKGCSRKIIGVVSINFSSVYDSVILDAIQETANLYEYTILSTSVIDNEAEISDALKKMSQMEVDGVVYLGGTMNEEIQDMLLEYKFPIILCSTRLNFNCNKTEEKFSSVRINYRLAKLNAIKYLYDLGHRSINIITTEEEINEFQKILDKKSFFLNDKIIFKCQHSFKSALEISESVLSQAKLPTAIICSCDLFALTVSREILRRGYKIPDEISILSLTGTEALNYFYPPITSIIEPQHLIGVKTVEILINELQKNERIRINLTLPTTLEIRKSCRQLHQKN